MDNEFCYLLRVRYSECDAQKVVFNAKYAEYVDIAVTEFGRAIWGDYNSIIAKGIDNQVVKLSIEWSSPAHFDDVIAITVKLKKAGNTSYSLQVDFYNYETTKIIASAEVIYVVIDASSHIKMTIPDDMRKQLEIGAPAVMVDHAAVDKSN